MSKLKDAWEWILAIGAIIGTYVVTVIIIGVVMAIIGGFIYAIFGM